jgi:hypothetical protein
MRPRPDLRKPVLHPVARSRTGIAGICLANVMLNGRRVLHIVANCGPRSSKFNAERLGRQEAMRRALRVRAAYELAGKGTS